VIQFNDGSHLHCHKTDLASYADDYIKFPPPRRMLMETLNSNKSFFEKHAKTNLNAETVLFELTEKKRAHLYARADIRRGEEIFCHYGFPAWFKKEGLQVGFMEEEEIEKNGFPGKLFEYPAFAAYINEFYPDNIGWEFHSTNKDNIDEFCIKINFKDSVADKNHVFMDVPNPKKCSNVSHLKRHWNTWHTINGFQNH